VDNLQGTAGRNRWKRFCV